MRESSNNPEDDIEGPDWLVYHPFFVWLRSQPNTFPWLIFRLLVISLIGLPIAAIVGGGATLVGIFALVYVFFVLSDEVADAFVEK